MVLVYQCLLTGDEMMSDSFPTKDVLDEEGNVVPGLFMVETKMVPAGDGEIDIGCGNAFGGDTEDAGPAEEVEMVVNLIKSFQLTETVYGSASEFKGYLKDYAGAILEKLKEQKEKGKIDQEVIKEWRTVDAPACAKFLLKKFSELQFYMGPSFNPESLVFSYYPDGATTPNFVFVRKGFATMKF